MELRVNWLTEGPNKHQSQHKVINYSTQPGTGPPSSSKSELLDQSHWFDWY